MTFRPVRSTSRFLSNYTQRRPVTSTESMADNSSLPVRRTLPRSHSSFATKAFSTDEAARLDRRFSAAASPQDQNANPLEERSNLLDERINSHNLSSSPQRRPFWERIFPSQDDDATAPRSRRWSRRRKSSRTSRSRARSLSARIQRDDKEDPNDVSRPKPGALPRPVGGSDKLGTFAGVFVPTTLNVLSILMFLRFGFILGQSGVIGMMGT